MYVCVYVCMYVHLRCIQIKWKTECQAKFYRMPRENLKKSCANCPLCLYSSCFMPRFTSDSESDRAERALRSYNREDKLGLARLRYI